MRAGRVAIPRRLRRAACLALSALGVGALVLPAAAAAWEEEPKAPEYSISIVEGETTLPEDPILSTSGYVRLPRTSKVQVNLRLVHNGLTVIQDPETNGNAGFSQVPQVGDIVYLESKGNVVGSVVYDGLPSMDPTVCAGSTSFSGQRSATEEVEGSYYTMMARPHYGPITLPGGEAQITSLSGSSFVGNFLLPLALGQTVQAVERLRTALAGGATFTYSSENDRPVGACPVPPPPPPPPPVALAGSIAKLARMTILRLLRSGWPSQVTINQPGTIFEDLYLQGGALPAFAAAGKHKHHHRKPPPAVLLARGTATAAVPGTVAVAMHLTAQGRRALRRARSVKVVLIATLRARSGTRLTLERRLLTLHR